MWAKTSKEESSGAGHDRLTQDASGDEVRVDASVTRVCCGKVIEPYLAEIRDRYGQTLFATVWRCPSCGRVTC